MSWISGTRLVLAVASILSLAMVGWLSAPHRAATSNSPVPRDRLSKSTLIAQNESLSAAIRLFVSAVPTSKNEPVYIGVWLPEFSLRSSSLQEFEQIAGTSVALVDIFESWGSSSVDSVLPKLETIQESGAVPLLAWQPWDPQNPESAWSYRLAAIRGGQYDDLIGRWADGLARHGRPVLLRFAHEMNLGRYPWAIGVNGNTAEDYRAVWQRVHNIFLEHGASNVRWVWSPCVAWDDQTAFEAAYPGDSFVNWLAVSGYNNPAWGGWQSFTKLFLPSYQRLVAICDKPIMVAETASSESGGSKADWIRSAFLQEIPTAFPRLRAVVWFNENSEIDGIDWRVQSSPASIAAFRDAVRLPLYRSIW